MGELIAAASVIVAAVTWFISQARDRERRQIAHSADLIATISAHEHLAKADFVMARMICKGDPIEEVGGDLLAEELDRHVMALLDYYEFVATLYFANVVHCQTIERLRGPTMRRAWHLCEGYIKNRRRLFGSDEIGKDLERFVKEMP